MSKPLQWNFKGSDDSLIAMQMLGSQKKSLPELIEIETTRDGLRLRPNIQNEIALHETITSNSDLEKFALAVVDESSGKVEVFDLPYFSGVFLKKREEPMVELEDAQELSHVQKRELLVKELGTKKNLKMLKNYQAKNAIDNGASIDEISKLLDASTEPIIEEAVQKKERRLSTLRNLLPSFNPQASEPKLIYQLSSLLEAKELEGVSHEEFRGQLKAHSVHPVLIRLMTRRNLKIDAANQNWIRYFSLLHHALTFLGYKKLNQNLKEVCRQESLDEKVMKALTEKFTEKSGNQLIISKNNKLRLIAFVVVLILLLFKFYFVLEDLSEDIGVPLKDLKQIVKYCGCVMESKEGQTVCTLTKLIGI